MIGFGWRYFENDRFTAGELLGRSDDDLAFDLNIPLPYEGLQATA